MRIFNQLRQKRNNQRMRKGRKFETAFPPKVALEQDYHYSKEVIEAREKARIK